MKESHVITFSRKKKTNKAKEKAFRFILNENSTEKNQIQDKSVNNKYKMFGYLFNCHVKANFTYFRVPTQTF